MKAPCPKCKRPRSLRCRTDGHGAVIEEWGECVRCERLCERCEARPRQSGRTAKYCLECKPIALRECRARWRRDRYNSDPKFREAEKARTRGTYWADADKRRAKLKNNKRWRIENADYVNEYNLGRREKQTEDARERWRIRNGYYERQRNEAA